MLVVLRLPTFGPNFATLKLFAYIRVEPDVVNPLSSIFPAPQVIHISNFRPLSLIVFILWSVEISSLFDSDYHFRLPCDCHLGFVTSQTA